MTWVQPMAYIDRILDPAVHVKEVERDPLTIHIGGLFIVARDGLIGSIPFVTGGDCRAKARTF